MTTTPPITIRASALPQFADCQRRTVSRIFPHQITDWGYELKNTPRGIGAMVGTATHTAAGWLLSEKVRTGEPGNLNEAIDRGVTNLKEQRDGADVNYDSTTPALGVGAQQVERMTRRYRLDVVPKANPTAVEQAVTFKTHRGNTISGHLDLTEDGPRDLKTGTSRRVNIAQYGSYSMLLRANGLQSLQVIEDYLPRVKIKDEQPPVETIYFDMYLAEDVAANIITMIEVGYERFMKQGDFHAFSANPNSVLCSAKYCGCFHSNFCPESKSKG